MHAAFTRGAIDMFLCERFEKQKNIHMWIMLIVISHKLLLLFIRLCIYDKK